MKCKYLLNIAMTALCCFYSSGFVSQAQSASENAEVDFFDTWNQVSELAMSFNEPIFVYLYTTYTPDCRKVENTVFQQKEFVNYFNNNFANYRLNLNSAEGMKFRSTYGIKEYPSFLFLTTQGDIINKTSGYKDANTLMNMGREALQRNVVAPESAGQISSVYASFLGNKLLYQNGVRTPDFLRDYLYDLKKFNEPYQTVMDEYIRSSNFSVTSFQYAQLLFDFTQDLHSKTFNVLLSEKSHFSNVLGREKLDQKLKEAFKATILNAVPNRDYEMVEDALRAVPRAGFSDTHEFTVSLQTLYYQNINDWNNYGNVVNSYANSGKTINHVFLEDLAHTYILNVSEKNKLEEANKWIEAILLLKADYFKALETHAIALYKLGKKGKSLKEAEKAIEAAKKKGLNYSSTMRLTDYINEDKPIVTKIR